MATAEISKKAKPRGKSFAKGVTGNPGGRPKRTAEELDLIVACKAKTPQALDTVLQIMESGKSEKNRLAAAQYVIERAWGKAVQPTELSGKDGGPIEHSIAVLFVSPNKK